jgi:sugar O-acyltransferase (sialic acid O-acetyltransferase NeuD family)
MNIPRVVLVGGGGHASDILATIEAINEAGPAFCDVAGIVADSEVDPRRFAHRGVGQIGGIDDLGRIDASHYVLAIGYSRPRMTVALRVAAFPLPPLTLVHPRAVVHRGVPVGPGAVIMAGAVVSAMASLGEHVCLHHNCIVGHDSRLEDFVTVLPGAAIGGEVTLRRVCLIGSGAVVIERLIVGAEALVGAGAVVTRDVPPGDVAMGVPARS